MTHTLLVLAHPRSDSLTAQVASYARQRREAASGTVDLLDLYGEDFDPRLTPTDEPDWENRDKVYSPEVRSHMDRVLAADEIVVVFPVWWFSTPAILKGWIDRVWAYGFAYGRSKPRLATKRMLWLGLAGGPAADYEKTGLGASLEHTLRVGVSEFCGVMDTSVRLLHDTELSGVPLPLRSARVGEILDVAGDLLDGFDASAASTAPEPGTI